MSTKNGIDSDWRTAESSGDAFTFPAAMPTSSAVVETVPEGIALVGAPSAWQYSTGASTRVLIIDTGYDRGHPDLPNTPLVNCLHGQYGGCDDGLPRPHGTSMTGAIMARQDGAGLVGMAPGVTSLNTFHWGACNSADGNCDTGEVISAVNWAANSLGALGVINFSLIKDSNSGALAAAIATAYNAGHLMVAGMGNTGSEAVRWPAAYSEVVAVGAVNPDKTFPNPNVDFCQPTLPGPTFGSHIDLVGPWKIGEVVAPGGGFYTNRCGGTSGATAIVSGLAAMIRSRNPTWPHWKVYLQMQNTAEDVHTVGWDPQTGFGLIRAPLAVGLIPPAIVGTIVSSKPRLTWSAVPLATDYVVYSKITPTICPNFQVIGSTAGTLYTDQSIQVGSLIGYDVPMPAYTAVSYQIFARSNGILSQASRVATYATNLANPPC